MKKKRPIQYTLREVSESLDIRLREAAAAEGTSLNQATLKALERGVGADGSIVRYRNLRDILGSGNRPDRSGWENILAELDAIDPTAWP